MLSQWFLMNERFASAWLTIFAADRYTKTIELLDYRERGATSSNFFLLFSKAMKKFLPRFMSQPQVTLNSWARQRPKKLRDKYRALADQVGPTMNM